MTMSLLSHGSEAVPVDGARCGNKQAVSGHTWQEEAAGATPEHK